MVSHALMDRQGPHQVDLVDVSKVYVGKYNQVYHDIGFYQQHTHLGVSRYKNR